MPLAKWRKREETEQTGEPIKVKKRKQSGDQKNGSHRKQDRAVDLVLFLFFSCARAQKKAHFLSFLALVERVVARPKSQFSRPARAIDLFCCPSRSPHPSIMPSSVDSIAIAAC